MGNLHAEYKCGEIFITKDGSFSWLCLICNENTIDCNEFIRHVCEEHFEKLVNKIDPLNLVEGILTKYKPCSATKNIIMQSTNFIEVDKDLTKDVENINLKENNECTTLEIELSSSNYDAEIISSKHSRRLNQKSLAESCFVCEICGRSYNAYQQQHQEIKCHNCQKFFQQQVNTDLDQRSNNQQIKDKKISIFGCKYCPRKFKLLKSVVSHEEQHENLRFKCSFCSKNLTSDAKLKEHIRIHTGERPYKCEKCSSAFTSYSNYKAHVLRHTGKKTFHCKFGCGKSFYMNCERVGHERSHTGEKPFVCEFCGKHWAFQHQLSAHKKRAHTDRQKWTNKCEYCGKTFAALSSLREHIVVHTGEKPHKCPECGGKFSKRSALRQHSKLHIGIKNYACRICSKTYAQSSGLYRHMKSHDVIKT